MRHVSTGALPAALVSALIAVSGAAHAQADKAFFSGKTVTYKGSCIVHDDRETKDWFYPEFSNSLRSDNAAAAAAFQKFLDSPHRVIIEFIPDYSLSFDASLMWARSPEAVAR